MFRRLLALLPRTHAQGVNTYIVAHVHNLPGKDRQQYTLLHSALVDHVQRARCRVRAGYVLHRTLVILAHRMLSRFVKQCHFILILAHGQLPDAKYGE